MSSIPEKTQVLVVGGGPAGAYAACVLGREGFDVTLVEAASFPRYHIGESFLPSLRKFLQFIELDDRVAAKNFWPKNGAAFKLRPDIQEGYTDFFYDGPENGSWNVVRSEFDNILFQYAKECNCHVFDETKIDSLTFEGPAATSKATSAEYTTNAGGVTKKGTIHFEYIVDASGRNGIISTKYLKNRKFNSTLKNTATWGYWKGCGVYQPGTYREGAAYFEALHDESGWVWFIPLHNGTVSVGVVVHEDFARSQKKEIMERDGDVTLKSHYLDEMKQAPEIIKLIANGQLVIPEGETGVKSASDYSYWCDQYAGPNWRLAGDSGAFMDPFFSSGVHLANTGGMAAAASIAASIRGHVSETDAARWHHTRVSTSFTRFLMVVLAAYKQMHSQREPVLTDIDQEGFANAFLHFRPIIQGKTDASAGKAELSEDELKATIDFCHTTLEHTVPEELKEVRAREGGDANTLYASNETTDTLVSLDEINKKYTDEKARSVARNMQGRKVLGHEQDLGGFSGETLNGIVPVVIRGELGLKKVEA